MAAAPTATAAAPGGAPVPCGAPAGPAARACHRRPGARRGFTLVEVMVALAVLALIAALGWQGIDGMLRSRDASRARLEAMLRLNAVLAQWEADLSALQATPAVPPLSFDGRTLRMTRRAEGGVQVVAWSLHDDPAAGALRRWQRWAGPAVATRGTLQEQWLRSQQLLGNEPGQVRVADRVADWQVYYYRNNAWSNAQSSADVETVAEPPAPGASAAQATLREVLPTGVRLVLRFEGGTLDGALVRDLALAPQGQP